MSTLTLNPLVSIIIPVYNGADFLRQAIDSTLVQSYSRIEVIVVNDGSTDGGKTRDISLSYGARVRYMERPNGGVAAALNTGIQCMEGDFFTWLSHDDLYYPQKIEIQLAFFERASTRPAMVYSDFDIIDIDGTCTGVCRIPARVAADPLLSILATLINGCSVMISKEIFGRVGLFDERLKTTQDNDMWMRIHRKGFPLFHIPEILIRSRRHAGQCQCKLADLNRRESQEFYRQAAKDLSNDPEQIKDILNSTIRSNVVLPFFFLWTLWTKNPTILKTGWMRYLRRRIIDSLRWRIKRS